MLDSPQDCASQRGVSSRPNAAVPDADKFLGAEKARFVLHGKTETSTVLPFQKITKCKTLDSQKLNFISVHIPRSWESLAQLLANRNHPPKYKTKCCYYTCICNTAVVQTHPQLVKTSVNSKSFLLGNPLP